MIDVFSLTDEEVERLLVDIQRRQAMKYAEARVAEVAEEYLNARDGEQPNPHNFTSEEDFPEFKAPQGGHDSYTAGRIVRFDGKLFRANQFTNHSPDEYAAAWTEVFVVDGHVTDERPVNPETGTPDYPDYDPSKTYYQNPDNSPLVIVKHNGKLWELIHSAAAPNYVPGAAGMHAVWADRGPAPE